MKKLSYLAVPALVMGASLANADVIGGTIEASYWYAGIGGDAQAGATSINMENDLNFDDEGFFEIAASVEHPVPLLPNVKLKHTSISQTETGSVGSGFDTVTGTVNTDLDLTHFDGILYYEILDNWVVLDLGLNIKKFDGHLNIEPTTGGGGTASKTEIDEILPLPYAKAEIELPFTGLAFGAELSGVSYSDNAFYDAKASLRQNIGLAFLEVGYRQIAIDFDKLGASKGISVDVDYSGIYLSTGLDF